MLARLVTEEDVRFVRADLDLLWGTDIDPEMWLHGELEQFVTTLRSPDHTFIGARDAHLKYGLLQEDLDVLQGGTTKPSPYSDEPDLFVYPVPEVVRAARLRYSDYDLLN